MKENGVSYILINFNSNKNSIWKGFHNVITLNLVLQTNHMYSYLPGMKCGQYVPFTFPLDAGVTTASSVLRTVLTRRSVLVCVLDLNGQMFSAQALQRDLYTQSCWSELTVQTTVQGLSHFVATENKPFVRTLL